MVDFYSLATMSQTTVDFADIKVETPTIEAVEVEYQNINTALERSQNRVEREQALQQWDDLRRRLDSWSNLTHLHFIDALPLKRRQIPTSQIKLTLPSLRSTT